MAVRQTPGVVACRLCPPLDPLPLRRQLAAQNCRKRKLDQILTLAEEVQRAKDQKQQTLADHQFLLQERGRIKEKYSQLYRHVFQVSGATLTGTDRAGWDGTLTGTDRGGWDRTLIGTDRGGWDGTGL